MTGEKKSLSASGPSNAVDDAEKTRKLIRDFVETPPAKTIADVKAASDVYEANAQNDSDARVKGKAKEEDPERKKAGKSS